MHFLITSRNSWLMKYNNVLHDGVVLFVPHFKSKSGWLNQGSYKWSYQYYLKTELTIPKRTLKVYWCWEKRDRQIQCHMHGFPDKCGLTRMTRRTNMMRQNIVITAIKTVHACATLLVYDFCPLVGICLAAWWHHNIWYMMITLWILMSWN